MSTSRLQEYMARELYNSLPHLSIKENHRPLWLNSNGVQLELDFYIEKMKCAIEVQGKQHYRYTPFFHNDYDGFLKQLERDESKKIICSNEDITLYEVSNFFEAKQLIYGLCNKSIYTITKETRQVFFQNKARSIDFHYQRRIEMLDRKQQRSKKRLAELESQVTSRESNEKEIDYINQLIHCRQGALEHTQYKIWLRKQRGKLKRNRGVFIAIDSIKEAIKRRDIERNRISCKMDKKISRIPYQWIDFWTKHN